MSDLFIHVNPILNGWLQSFLFTVLNEELLLLFKAARCFHFCCCCFVFFPLSPSNWAAEWGRLDLYENASPQWNERRFPSFSHHAILHHLKEGKALHCSCNDSALQHIFRWWITHKYALTKAWRSTWKCLFTARRPVTWSVSLYGESRYIHFALEVWMDSKALSSLTFKWPSAVFLYMCGKTSSSIYFCNFSLFFIGTGAAKMM